MKLEVFDEADSVARAAAATSVADARTAIAARGRFALAVIGGHTPWGRGSVSGEPPQSHRSGRRSMQPTPGGARDREGRRPRSTGISRGR